ncbi:hypothetical protein BGZ83_004175 [Gryganskiella cystojenkinii]|nr:hypothetical protein BGZ83_004175 [Gryganskiella cystojenkinii]
MVTIGCELLMHTKDYEPQCIRFMQLLFAKSIQCRQQILIEIALYQMRCGKIEDAYTTLEPYITTFPYNENALILGYAGVIEYALWMKAVHQKHKRGEDAGEGQDVEMQDVNQGRNSDDIGDIDEWSDGEGADELDHQAMLWNASISRHGHAALNLLERSLQLDGSNDMFLTYLVRIKCGKIGPEGLGSTTLISRTRRLAINQTKAYLKKYLSENKGSLQGLHLLAALENREKLQTLETIFNIDPTADSNIYIQPMLRLYRQELPLEQRDLVKDIASGLVKTVKQLKKNDFSYSTRVTDLQMFTMPTADDHSDRHMIPYLEDMHPVLKEEPLAVRKTRSSSRTQKENIDGEENNQEQDDDGDDQENDPNNGHIVTTRSGTRTPKKSKALKDQRRWTFEQMSEVRQHQPDVKYFRPMLQLLLRRAEYGVMTDAEEAEILRISNLFCFCSLYCRRVPDLEGAKDQLRKKLSCLQDLPERMQPAWLKRVVMIMCRRDDYL